MHGISIGEECGWDGGDCCENTCASAEHTCGSRNYFCLDPSETPSQYASCDGVGVGTWIADGQCDDINNNEGERHVVFIFRSKDFLQDTYGKKIILAQITLLLASGGNLPHAYRMGYSKRPSPNDRFLAILLIIASYAVLRLRKIARGTGETAVLARACTVGTTSACNSTVRIPRQIAVSMVQPQRAYLWSCL